MMGPTFIHAFIHGTSDYETYCRQW